MEEGLKVVRVTEAQRVHHAGGMEPRSSRQIPLEIVPIERSASMDRIWHGRIVHEYAATRTNEIHAAERVLLVQC